MIKKNNIHIKNPIKIGTRKYSSQDLIINGSLISLVFVLIYVIYNYSKKNGDNSPQAIEKDSDPSKILKEDDTSDSFDLLDITGLYAELI
jgi:hypothetical protein